MNHPSASPPGTDFDQAVQLATHGGKESTRLTKRGDLKVEELVLKRCWLARYWGLAAKLGLYPRTAHKKHAVWAGLAPQPVEVVISAGQKAKSLATEQRPLISISSANSKEDVTIAGSPGRALSTSGESLVEEDEMIANGSEDSRMGPTSPKDEGDSGIERQLLVVEEGLRELVELRVEEAVLLKISQNQNPTLIWLGLSIEQAQDIRFKQAWLVYYWRRVQVAGTAEHDVAVERLLYWMDRTTKPPSYEDAVNVHRGLDELRGLGIDSQGRLN